MERIATFKSFPHIGENVFKHLNNLDIKNCHLACQSWNRILNDSTLLPKNLATFKGIPKIGIKIFKNLDQKTLLNCLLVCKSWNEILTYPKFWLNKLNKIQSFKGTEQWMNLIVKFKEFDIVQRELAIGLKEEYFDNVRFIGKSYQCKFCKKAFHYYDSFKKHVTKNKQIILLEDAGFVPTGTHEELERLGIDFYHSSEQSVLNTTIDLVGLSTNWYYCDFCKVDFEYYVFLKKHQRTFDHYNTKFEHLVQKPNPSIGEITYENQVIQNVATFRGLTHIAEKVFANLNKKDTLNCIQVCKSWNSILSNSMLWLNKLKKLGEPSLVTEQWLSLIEKSQKLGLDENLLSVSMCSKYYLILRCFSKKASAEKEFSKNMPPILIAIRSGRVDIVKRYADLGANFDEPIQLTSTKTEFPIFYSLKSEQFEIVKVLLSKMKTPVPEMKDQNGFGLLHVAALYGNLDIVEIITPLCKNRNERCGARGTVPIQFALMNSTKYRKEIVYFLSDICNVNIADFLGKTPLKHALILGQLDSMEILVPLTKRNILEALLSNITSFESVDIRRKGRKILENEISKRNKEDDVF